MICPICLITADAYSDFDSLSDEGFLRRCTHCGSLLFAYECSEDFTYRFEVGFGSEAIKGIAAWNESDSIYRRVPFRQDLEVSWPVYVSNDKPVKVRAFKEECCELLKQRRYPSKGNRLQISLPTRRKTRAGKTAYHYAKVSRLVKLAWGGLGASPRMLVLHKKDNRNDDSHHNTTLGDHRTNSEEFHDNRRRGDLSPHDLVAVNVPRGIIDQLRKHYRKPATKALIHALDSHLEMLGYSQKSDSAS